MAGSATDSQMEREAKEKKTIEQHFAGQRQPHSTQAYTVANARGAKAGGSLEPRTLKPAWAM